MLLESLHDVPPALALDLVGSGLRGLGIFARLLLGAVLLPVRDARRGRR
jgi:hypothetical protein